MSKTPSGEYEEWLASLTPETIRGLFRDRGCTQVMVKLMSPQDDGKHQPWVANDLAEVAWMHPGDVTASTTASQKAGAAGKTKFTAPLKWSWIAPRGDSPAPAAKLIYYPQYPEVRLSGLVDRSVDPPSSLYNHFPGRQQAVGRRLLIGLNPTDQQVWAMILPPNAAAGPEIDRLASDDTQRVFRLWDITSGAGTGSTLEALLRKLGEIHAMGPVAGRKLMPTGPEPYAKQNAGGYTLEALCGVLPNSIAGPDYLGWELKAHDKAKGNNLTLFTPAPDGGLIKDIPRIDFMQRYGRERLKATVDEPGRWDFTGPYVHGAQSKPGRLTLALEGWDGARGLLPTGGLVLRDQDRDVMVWSFAKLMDLWKTKHAQTVYVPYVRKGADFAYQDTVLLGVGTSFFHLLRGLEAAAVIYDPGLNIKEVERASGPAWKAHDRHQFRAKLGALGPLYDDSHWERVLS